MFLEVGGISPVPTTSRSSGGGGQEAPCRAGLGRTSSVRFGPRRGLSLRAAGATCRERELLGWFFIKDSRFLRS